MVDAAKKAPGKLNWGYPGAGTTQHLTGELFKQVAGVDIQGVMYKGSAQAVQDLLGDSIQLSVDGIGPNLSHIKSGKLHALASTGEQRSSQLPDVPTVAEQGYPGFDYTLWVGLWGQSALPADIAAKINKDVNAALASPDVRERLTKLGTEPGNMSLPEFSAFVRKEIDETQKILHAAGIKPQ
jgi:tripartite-type tricarboxylate transporter receptor subunit TctC